MARGKRRRDRQAPLRVAAEAMANSPEHPFYEALDGILDEPDDYPVLSFVAPRNGT